MPRIYRDTKVRSSAPNPQRLEKALFDMWAFADCLVFHGGSKKFGTVHRELTTFLSSPQILETSEEGLRRLVLMPRGHLKSTVCSVLYVLWRIYRNPNIRILYACNTKRLAKSFIRQLRMYLENDEIKQAVWNKRPHIEGELIPALSANEKRQRNARRNQRLDEEENPGTVDTKFIWSLESLQVNREDVVKEPTVQVTSVGTNSTGDHYDLIIMDDVVDFMNSDTEEKGEDIINWAKDYESVLDPRREYEWSYSKGKRFIDKLGDETVILGTRYYSWDYYNYLLENAEDLGIVSFTRNIYKNGSDDTEGYLWPEKFNQTILRRIRSRLNDQRRFMSQYLNTISDSENCPLCVDDIVWFMPEWVIKEGVYELRTHAGTQPEYVSSLKLFIEPAATVGAKSDYTVVGVGGYSETGKLFIFALRVGRFTTSEVMDITFELLERFNLTEVTVETVGGFALYTHILKEESTKRGMKFLRVTDYKPSNQISKETRILTRLEPLFIDKRLYMNRNLSVQDTIREQLSVFPNGKHDDVPDAIATIATICESSLTRGRRKKAAYTARVYQTPNSRWGGFL